MVDINTQNATIDNVPLSFDPEDAKTREMIDECLAGMQSLRKSDLQELKVLSNPPAAVIEVMKAVMVAFGYEPTWDNAKKQLASFNFL